MKHLFLISLMCLFSFEVFGNFTVYDLLPTGTYEGISGSEACVVKSTVQGTESVFKIQKESCDSKSCAVFRGQEQVAGGGGCTGHIYQSEFGAHLTNGKNPQGAPGFCSGKFKPVSIRVLRYQSTLKVEIFANKTGTVIAGCTVLI